MNGRVSVIVPVYNTPEEYLEECIKSILTQTYEDLEILIIDDGSDEKTASACKRISEYDNRIKLIRQKNSGVSAARNKGIDYSRSPYITFVDSDDVISNKYVEILMRTLTSRGVDIAIAQQSSDKNYEEIITDKEAVEVGSDEAVVDLLYTRRIPTGPFAKMFTRNIVGQHRFCEEYAIAEDLELNYKVMSDAKSIVIIDDSLYYYRPSTGSAMRSPFSRKRMDGLRAVKKVLEVAVESGKSEVISAATFRYFMEAIFIGVKIITSVESYNVEYKQCIAVMKECSRNVAYNRVAPLFGRSLGLVSIVSPAVAIRVCIGKMKIKGQL